MDPREQVLARGRHPGEHRLHQVRRRRARPILRLRSLCSLCSLRHWRLLGPGVGDRLSWSTRFSRRPGSRRYSVLKFNRGRDIPLDDAVTLQRVARDRVTPSAIPSILKRIGGGRNVRGGGVLMLYDTYFAVLELYRHAALVGVRHANTRSYRRGLGAG